MKHVIVGAGPAGVVAAETLRRAAPDDEVVLIGEENEPPYSRMAIPYFLIDRIGEDGTYLRKTDGHYDALGIKHIRARAEKLSPDDHVLSLDNGETVSYDRLLIATGSHPVKPPIPGLDLPAVHHCWTLEDARSIHRLARPGSHVVLMGAGFIGCIILEALALRDVQLTVVEAEPQMVPRMMDETAGGMLTRWCESKGVTVRTGTRVSAVEPHADAEDTLTVDLDNGDTIHAHLVVVATGVAPNVGFLEGTGIEIDQGILVDDMLRTTVDDIYAAGDVAQGPDFSIEGRSVHAIQPTATDHGRVAALNMVGRESRYSGSLSMNTLDTLGLITASFGAWQGVEGGETASQVDEAGYRYMRLEFKDDRLVGAICAGRTDHIGVLRGLIQSEVPLGPWKERLKADPSLIAEAYIDCTQG
ncbi:MAG: FAD-dependent oxidoreductase [Rhodospirillales bacterium]|nr:FAD-dependent oxidoreductase [Rhodospirillales bacterium]